MRYLILIHRYLGTAIGILMVGWCLSGIVMMYVRYPAVSQAERLRQLKPLAWRECCTLGANSIPTGATVEGFQVENLAGHPMLHVQFSDRSRELIALSDGRPLAGVSRPLAADVAREAGTGPPPRLLGLLTYDEWTVSGEFNRARPLYLFARDDAAGTQVYVSARTGRVVQQTTSHQRFWNWIGAVPHWLYFAQLRRNVALWSQVVIWTSLAGCFLVLFGLYIGIRQFLHRPAGRWSGYRGLMYWHHVPGLIFGLFALTWVTSGLVSMNPWGFLDSAGAGGEMDDLIGPPISAAAVYQAVRALPAASLPPDVVAVESSRLFGQLYIVATRTDGTRLRLRSDGTPTPLADPDWNRITEKLGGKSTAVADLITMGDSYYSSRAGVPAQLPVVRVTNSDNGMRYYLDPVTGAPLEVLDSDARWYRWLHRGLHTLDFAPLLRSRPLWDVLMVTLLAGAALLCGTGTWLGWRRYIRIRPGRPNRN